MTVYGFEGHKPVIHPRAYVHPSAQVIGNVHIGADCFVGAGAIVRGDWGTITIGERVAVEEGCIIHGEMDQACHIGSDVVLGHGCIIHCAEIHDNARIGMGAVVALRSVVEEWAVIADGSVVPPSKRLASGRVYMGNPVRDVRALSDEERKTSSIVVELYAGLCDRYRAGLENLSGPQ